MKLNKTLGRVATTLVAATMLASVSAVPAFADQGDQQTPPPSGLQSGDTISIQKNLKVGANIYTPDTTFNFTVAPAAPDQVEVGEGQTETEKHNGIVVEQGPANGVTQTAGADFDVSENPMTTATTVTENATLKVDLTQFTTYGPGVYKYTVQEDATSPYEGVTYDNSVKTLYVTIVTNAAGGLEVKSTELYNSDKETKSNSFNNDYDADTNTLHDVTITKDVVGDFGDLQNDSFTFNIKVNGATNEKYKIVYAATANTSPTTDFILSDDSNNKSITVKDGGYVTIYGLSANDEYTVTETNYADKGYTAYVDADYKAENYTDGKTYATVATKSDTLTDKTSEDTHVVIFNEKSGTVATGIVMNVAPYVLLVVVAAAGCFVFLRKRRED